MKTNIKIEKARRKRFRKLVIVSGIIAGVILAIFIVAGFILQSRVKEILLKEINKQLTAEVEVLSVDVSLIRNFPQVSLQFHNVRIPSLPGDNADLISAEFLSLQFSIIDIIRKNYSIRNITISNGKLSILLPEAGEPNYMILREGEEDGEAISFALRKVQIRNVDIEYRDRINDIDISLFSTRTIFRGNFSADEYKLRATGSIRVDQLRVGNDRFFSGQNSVIDLVMDIDNKRSLYTISRGNLDVEGLPFVISGRILNASGIENIELDIEGNRMKIAHLIDLLPEEYSYVKSDYSPSGRISFKGSIRGSYAGKSIPVVQFSFGIDDGIITHNASGLKLQGIEFQGDYRYSESDNDLAVNNFTAQLGDGTIKGSFAMLNLKNPEIRTELQSDLSVADLLVFFPVKNIYDGEGRMRLNLKAETALSLSENFSITHLLHSRSNGELELSSVSFRIENDSRLYTGLNGRMVFDNNDVRVTDFKASVNQTTLYFAGYFRNLFPYLLVEDQKLEFKGELKSASVNMRDMLFGGSASGSKGSNQQVNIPGRITGSLDLQIETLRFDAFRPTDIKGRLRVEPGRLYAEQVKMNAFNGTLHGAILLSQLTNGEFSFNCELNSTNADIKMLFSQFNNFGQDDITDKNLRGLLTSRIRVQSKLTPQLVFKVPDLEAIGELVVDKGALIDYEPVKALARYTRLDDLSDIRFNTLRNEIRIADQIVIIPEMMIRSDAIDLSVSGTHSFNGEISYQIRMLLSEILSGKARRANQRNSEIDLTQQDQRGRLTMHLLIDGTVDNPVVRYDRRSLREKVREDAKTEKEELKELFKQEFGTFNRSNDKTEMESARKKEGEIIIEWDDD